MRRQKLTYEEVKESFENEGYTLLSTEYINNKSKLDYVCPNGHKHSISWTCWQQGKRCGKCNDKHKRMSIESVKESFESEGYILVSTEYVNNQSKLEFICPNGHEHNTKWMIWKQGHRCGKCSRNCFRNTREKYEFIKQSFEDEGYTLLSTEYINGHDTLYFICPNGHEHNIIWDNWKYGKSRCGKCYYQAQASQLELELHEYINTLGIDFIPNDRTIIINPSTGWYLELDLWFPDMKKAIEFNGGYWHNTEKVIKNDRIKKEFCEWKGIDLMTVWDDDWNKSREQEEERVREFLVA